MPRKRKRPDMFTEMVKHSAPGHLCLAYGDSAGIVAINTKSTPPTRDELIRSYMAIPVYTPTHRLPSGAWAYHIHHPTHEEAAAKTSKAAAWLDANYEKKPAQADR